MLYYYNVLVSFFILFETSLAFELVRYGPEEYSETIPGEYLVHIPAGFDTAKRIADAEGFRSIYEVPKLKIFHLYDLKPSEETQDVHISIRLTQYKEITYVTPLRKEKIGKQQKTFRRTTSFAKEDYIYCAGKESKFYSTDRPQFYKDPYYRQQWYMRNCSDLEGSSKPSYYDMKIVPTLEHFKVTGKGIIVLVVDSGVYKGHADLRNKVSREFSKNHPNQTDDPTPDDPSENHGTRCAGIIAMEANNGVCGAGIAPGAIIGGQKFGSGRSSYEHHKAEAYSYKAEGAHIVNLSIGDVEHAAFQDMRPALYDSIQNGIENGRGGKGLLYVFASGNEKGEKASCSTEGSASPYEQIIVGGAKYNGDASDYAEGCPGVMMVTHSGSGNPYAHVTTDLGSPEACFDNFNGTSAGAPVASGILALVLEANPELSWRDVKHAIAWTSEVAPLAHNPGWMKNGAGFWVNYDFGFGLINAYELVQLAKNFPGTLSPDHPGYTPPMSSCVAGYELKQNEKHVSGVHPLRIEIPVDGCKGSSAEVNYIEHVHFVFSINHVARGNLQIVLKSPQKTVTLLLPPRPQDQSNLPITNYPIPSVHNWGENPDGIWTVEIIDTSNSPSSSGEVENVDLIFYGTREKPKLYENGPRKYYPFSLK